ncbi:hypothetical protein EDB19DRAFT_826639 [Suillus lakei]|nr:hypothetical protein EDB19DRAFT_826639 [Suillus lakei]
MSTVIGCGFAPPAAQQLIQKQDMIIQSIHLRPTNQSLISPFLRLAIELLSQNFIHCLLEFDQDYPSPESRPAPIQLTRVCRRWREVSADIPSLWCRQCSRQSSAMTQAITRTSTLISTPVLPRRHDQPTMPSSALQLLNLVSLCLFGGAYIDGTTVTRLIP